MSIVFACMACALHPPPPLPTGHQQKGPAIKVWVCSRFLPAKGDFFPAIVACSRVRLLLALEHIEILPVVMDAF